MASSFCEQCGEATLDAEEMVCESCGFVTEQIQFGSNFTPSSSSNFKLKHRLWSSKSAHRPDGLTYGLEMVKHLKNVYNLTSDVEAEILDLFNKIYKTKTFRCREDIGIIAGCCLMRVQKENKQCPTLPDLCSKLKCTKRRFFRLSKCVKSYCDKNIDDEPPKAEEEPEQMFHGDLGKSIKNLVPTILEKVPSESKDKLIEKTLTLLKLANSCWLITGRSPRSCVIAASFLCWKSMDPSRKVLSFTKFCSQFLIQPRGASVRVAELKAMLVKLGRNIPSYSKNYVNDKNVIFHLDYILENSETLRNDMLEGEFSEEAMNAKEFSSFRVIRKKPCRREDPQNVTYDSDMCASDIEISDTEISSYVRNDEEKDFIKVLHGLDSIY